jgi:hypothetical protein
MASDSNVEQLAQQLEQDLLHLYGSPLITGEDLQRALGYRSIDALRKAIVRKSIPVSVFSIEHRRGKYALIKDIARWLAKESLMNKNKEE